jgi:hypothetical protein
MTSLRYAVSPNLYIRLTLPTFSSLQLTKWRRSVLVHVIKECVETAAWRYSSTYYPRHCIKLRTWLQASTALPRYLLNSRLDGLPIYYGPIREKKSVLTCLDSKSLHFIHLILYFRVYTLRLLYPRGWHGTHCIEGWVGPRDGLDGCWISRFHRDSIPGSSSL